MRKLIALALAALLAQAAPAAAAITLVTRGTNQSAGAPAVTGLTTTTATLLVACVSSDSGNGTGQTVSDNKGNTWTRLVRLHNGVLSQIEMWYSLPTSVGASHNITYSGNFGTIAAAAYAGTATSSVLDGSVTSAASAGSVTTMQPGSITPSQANGLLVTCLNLDGGQGTDAINQSFTIRQDAALSPGVAYGGGLADLIQGAAAAVNPTWSNFTSTPASATMQAFNDPGGGGGATSAPLRSLMGVGR